MSSVQDVRGQVLAAVARELDVDREVVERVLCDDAVNRATLNGECENLIERMAELVSAEME